VALFDENMKEKSQLEKIFLDFRPGFGFGSTYNECGSETLVSSVADQDDFVRIRLSYSPDSAL
jgi:hypothetical protein